MNRIISSSPLVLVLCLFVLGLAPKMAQAEWLRMSDYDFTNPDNTVKVYAGKVEVREGTQLLLAQYFAGPKGFAIYDLTTMVVFIPDDTDVYDMVAPDGTVTGTMYLYPACVNLRSNRKDYINICKHVGDVAATMSDYNPSAFDYMWVNIINPV